MRGRDEVHIRARAGLLSPPLLPVRAPWAARPKSDPCRFCNAESPTEEKEMRAVRNALQIGMMLASWLSSLANSKEEKPREGLNHPSVRA
jgi:hypothetical protein